MSAHFDFSLQINNYNCKGFHNVINDAAVEMIQRLAYLPAKGIAHRDVKPANILVCNRHYNTLSDAQKNRLEISLAAYSVQAQGLWRELLAANANEKHSYLEHEECRSGNGDVHGP